MVTPAARPATPKRHTMTPPRVADGADAAARAVAAGATAGPGPLLDPVGGFNHQATCRSLAVHPKEMSMAT